MRIAILVDNPDRDLPGAVLLSLELARRGATALLVPFNLRRSELRTLRADIVVLNNLYKILDDFVLWLGERYAIAVLDNEGAVWCDFDEYRRALTDNTEIRDRTALYLCWGSYLARTLVSEGLFRDEQVMVTGHPRLDFYAARWRKSASDRAEFDDRPEGAYILIASKHPLANPRFQSVEREVDILCANGYERHEALDYLAEDQANFDRTVAMIAALCQAMPEMNFVLRPHPFERAETYVERLEDSANLVIRQNGTIDGWLIGASALVQRSSSTAIEAVLLGIPSISPDWVPPLDEEEWPLKVSYNCNDMESLIDHVRRAAEGRLGVSREILAALDEVRKTWLGPTDGESYSRVADALLALPESAARPSSKIVSPGVKVDAMPKSSLSTRLGHIARDPKLVPGIVVRKISGGRWGQAMGGGATESASRIAWDDTPKAFSVAAAEALAAPIYNALAKQMGSFGYEVRAADDADYEARHESSRTIAIAPKNVLIGNPDSIGRAA